MNTLGRVFVVLVICIGLPLLALPKVRQRVEDFLYGKLETVLPPLPPKPAEPTPVTTETADKPEDIQRLAFNKDVPPPPATFNSPPLIPGNAPADLSPATPPQLTPIPVDPAALAPAPATIPGPQITDATMQQVRAIRRQLEDLGAEYILLESVDGGRTYRFHCQMATDARRTQLQPFEAAMTSPLAAAEAVLAQVQRWRSAPPQPTNAAPRATSPTFSQ